MPQRATAVACSNIAFVKYWGQRDPALVLPWNASLSMNLDHCLTTTTVQFDASLNADEVEITWFGQAPAPATGRPRERVVAHLDRVRARAGLELRARVTSANTFPADAGIASSAAGFAALTAAAAAAAGLALSERELSILTRLSGSGSACRSIPGGFVHWHDDGSEAGSYAESIAPPAHWALADVVAVVESGPKSVGSAENHHLATTSAYFGARLAELPPRIAACVDAIQARDLSTLGRESEADAISLHVIAMTAQPPTLYWKPGTLAIMHAVHGWRRAGLAAYWTIDAGANVHVICAQADAAEVATRLEALPEVQWTITNGPGPGVRVHLE